MAEQPRRVVQVGVVTSARMQKTVKVLVERRRQVPRYKKYVSERTTYLAHDEQGVAREGDWVEIVQTRPLSRRKRWRLLRVLAGPVGSMQAPSDEVSVTDQAQATETVTPVGPAPEAVVDGAEVSEQL